MSAGTVKLGFWHGRVLQEDGTNALAASLKTKRREFWIRKIGANVERDRVVTQALADKGWTVIRLWESDLKRDLETGVEAVIEVVAKGRNHHEA